MKNRIRKAILKVVGLNFIEPDDINKAGGSIGEGNFFSFLPLSVIDPGRLRFIHIGNNNVFSRINLFAHDYSWAILSEYDQHVYPDFGNKIWIADNNFFGYDTLILPGVTVGSNNVIAARSVITKNIGDGEVWAGVPACKIGTIEAMIENKKAQYVVQLAELINSGNFNEEKPGFIAFYYLNRTKENYDKFIKILTFKNQKDSPVLKEIFFSTEPEYDSFSDMKRQLQGRDRQGK